MKSIRMVPSVAVRMTHCDIFKGIVSSFRSSPEERFERSLKEVYPFQFVTLHHNARTGLMNLLEILKKKYGRQEVIIPAYTCSTVVYSVINAGLKPVLCDINKDSLNIEPSLIRPLISPNTLAVICADMFGKRCEIDNIRQQIKDTNVFLIEDSAQAADCVILRYENNTYVKPDFILLSFGKGKNITTIEGGAILGDNSQIMSELRQMTTNYQSMPLMNRLLLSVKLFLYPILIHPNIFFFIKLFNLNYNNQRIQPFPVPYKFTGLQAGIGRVMLKKLYKLNNDRISNVSELTRKLNKSAFFTLQDGSENVCLRLVVIFRKPGSRDAMVAKSNSIGINSTSTGFTVLTNYLNDSSIKDDDYPVSKYVSENIIAFPSHSYLSLHDKNKIVSILNSFITHNE